MHDAAISGIRCAREYGAITQGKVGGTADQVTLAGRAALASPVDAL